MLCLSYNMKSIFMSSSLIQNVDSDFSIWIQLLFNLKLSNNNLHLAYFKFQQMHNSLIKYKHSQVRLR